MTQGVDGAPALHLRQRVLALVPGLTIDNGLNALFLGKLQAGLGPVTKKANPISLMWAPLLSCSPVATSLTRP